MSVFSFHLARVPLVSSLKVLIAPPEPKNIPGLIHAECMTCMTLGSEVYSPSRMLLRQMAVFAQWENESAIDNFLTRDSLGKLLHEGWHTRMDFLRQWGYITEFAIPKEKREADEHIGPVVAVTIARMKLPQVPRFIRWGRPVEQLVRDHPGTTLALAAIRLPRTVSTFSVWKSQKEMTDMVHGHSSVPRPERHAAAMKERERKDFHYQFTTLRFRPISEYGTWNGRTNIIPDLSAKQKE
jgi:hypothetical protein